MRSWQWGYKDNDMWLLGFLRGAKQGQVTWPNRGGIISNIPRRCSILFTRPTCTNLLQAVENYAWTISKRTNFKVLLRHKSMGGYVYWPSPNQSHEMHPMLKCCSWPLEWFALDLWDEIICQFMSLGYTSAALLNSHTLALKHLKREWRKHRYIHPS
jgi:hypothetical protein